MHSCATFASYELLLSFKFVLFCLTYHVFVIFVFIESAERAKQSHILQMVREEDKVTQEKFTRVQRALDGRNVGMKQSHLKNAPAENIFNSSAASLRRSGLLFTNAAEEKSHIEGEYETILAQNEVRHAQDMLLLQQLDKGVLPERFIKQGVYSDDPRHVSVILSKYGIGDTGGICLGKW